MNIPIFAPQVVDLCSFLCLQLRGHHARDDEYGMVRNLRNTWVAGKTLLRYTLITGRLYDVIAVGVKQIGLYIEVNVVGELFLDR